MPSIGDKSVYGVWDGKKWVAGDSAVVGSAKSGEQLKGELGFKSGATKPASAPLTGLAAYAAKNRVKTMEEQARAVEEESEKKKKKAPKE